MFVCLHNEVGRQHFSNRASTRVTTAYVCRTDCNIPTTCYKVRRRTGEFVFPACKLIWIRLCRRSIHCGALHHTPELTDAGCSHCNTRPGVRCPAVRLLKLLGALYARNMTVTAERQFTKIAIDEFC
jgi:hypothetical protein